MELLVYGLSSLLLSTIAVLDGVSGARILLTANAADERLVIAMSQDRMAIEEPPADRAAPAPVDARLASAHLSILALRRIAESHDGRVSVVRSGAGARVSIDLPLDATH